MIQGIKMVWAEFPNCFVPVSAVVGGQVGQSSIDGQGDYPAYVRRMGTVIV
jgi:hypothetical protein